VHCYRNGVWAVAAHGQYASCHTRAAAARQANAHTAKQSKAKQSKAKQRLNDDDEALEVCSNSRNLEGFRDFKNHFSVTLFGKNCF
jgi:hypothetical protein